MHVKFLETLDWSILIAYFLILIAIGIWASSKRKKGSSLFLAENSLKWYHIGFSMWGTNVGPSMLIASASAGFTTGIVSGNYAWYAFVFICLLAFVFAPRYLGSRITTLPEFMGKRFGQSTRNILAWYTIITILISWLALTLFAGGVLIRQVFDIPMWQSALLLLVISAFFTMLGGLKAVAYTNVYQMILLIVVSATLAIMGIYKVGGVGALVDAVPADYWNLFHPNDDPAFPWLYYPGLSYYGSLVLVYGSVDGATGSCCQESQRRTDGNQLYRMVENIRCTSLHSSRHYLPRFISTIGKSR